MNTYDAGTLVQVSATFTNTAGTASDPGAVTCGVRKGDGTLLTPAPTVTKDSVGNYHATIDTTGGPQGVWSYEFSGTAPLQAIGDSQFYVKVLGY